MTKRIFFRGLVVTITVGMFLGNVIWGEFGVRRYRQARHYIARYEQEAKQLQNEIDYLTKHREAMKHDDFYYEKLVREKLLLGKSGETIYRSPLCGLSD